MHVRNGKLKRKKEDTTELGKQKRGSLFFAAISFSLLPIFVIQKRLLEDEIQDNGIAEYVVFHNKIESQLPGSVNNMDEDEAEKKQGILVLRLE